MALTGPQRQAVLAELQQLEPLLYTANAGRPRAWFEQLLAPDFWEVGASGARYTRDEVLDVLAQRQGEPREEAWSGSDYAVREAGAAHYLLSYVLTQPTRVSRRVSLWRRGTAGWQLLYHQGTVSAWRTAAEAATPTVPTPSTMPR